MNNGSCDWRFFRLFFFFPEPRADFFFAAARAQDDAFWAVSFSSAVHNVICLDSRGIGRTQVAIVGIVLERVVDDPALRKSSSVRAEVIAR